jgi:hypothetical protein
VNGWLTAAAALTLPLTALAADWVKVPVPDVNQHWYDRSKVQVEGDGITYWRRVEFRVPQRAKAGVAGSAMYRERIDCHTHDHRTLGYLLYAQDGTVIENVHKPDAEAEPTVPETVGDQFEKVMCALAAQRMPEAKLPGASTGLALRSPEEIRQEIQFLEARLRILREQLEHEPKPQVGSEPAIAPGAAAR